MDPTNTNTALASVSAEELFRCGLRRAVVSPGSRSTPLAIALYRQPGIDVTVVLDERSAGFFALGAAHATGEPVALLCTSGTAAANYHPAVAEADLSGAPLIVLTADRPPELRDVGAGQTIDQIKLFGSAVRWFCEVGVHQADDSGLIHFRSTACRAFAAAAGDPRPGPVHLNFPFTDPLDPSPVDGAVTAGDRLAVKGRDDGPLTRVVRTSPRIDDTAFGLLVETVDSAARPLIVAGRQADPGLRVPLTDLASHLSCPILAEPTSQLRLGPHDRSALVDAYDLVISKTAAEGRSELDPDLVIRVGETPVSKNLRGWLAGLRDTTQVVVDPSYGWHEPSRISDLIVRTDPAELCRRLKSNCETSTDGIFRNGWIEAGHRQTADPVKSDALDPQLIHEALGRSYRDGDVVYTASSMAIRDQESHLPSGPADVTFLSNRGANGIDGLLASAAGAAASTGRPVTAVTGELGFQHDLGSLALVASSSVPVRIVVINDGGGIIFSKLPQKDSMPAREFEDLMNTASDLNIETAAAAFSIPYSRVDDPPGLDAALEQSGPVVIEIDLTVG